MAFTVLGLAIISCSDAGIKQESTPPSNSDQTEEALTDTPASTISSNSNNTHTPTEIESHVDAEHPIVHVTNETNSNPEPSIATGPAIQPTTDYLDKDHKARSMFDYYAKKARDSFLKPTNKPDFDIGSYGAILSTMLVGIAPDTSRINPETQSATDWTFLPLETNRQLPFLGDGHSILATVQINNRIVCDANKPSGFVDIHTKKVNYLGLASHTEEIQSGKMHYHTVANYSECQTNASGPTFSGRVEAYYTEANTNNNSYQSFENITISYDGLIVTFNEQNVSYTGSTFMLDGNDCGRHGQMEETMLLSHFETGTQLLFTDMQQIWYEPNSKTDINACANKKGLASYVEAYVYHSEYGEFSLDTEGYGPLPENENIYRQYSNLVLSNFYNESVYLRMGHDERLPNADQLNIAKLTFYSPDETNYPNGTIANVLANDIARGAIADLNDSDVDGMVNSWEQLYALNGQDANDASLDSDADGVPNLIESESYGDPQNADLRGINVDTSIELTIYRNSFSQYLSLEAQLSIPSYQPTEHNYNLRFESTIDGEWLDLPSHCILNKREAVCDANTTDWMEPRRFRFAPSQDAFVELTASINAPPLDNWNSNDLSSIEENFNSFEIDFDISVPEHEELALDKPKQIGATIKLLPGSDPYPLRLHVELPKQLRPLSFHIRKNNEPVGIEDSCFFTRIYLRCSMPEAQPEDEWLFLFNIVGESTGEYEIKWHVATAYADENPENNLGTTKVVVTDQ